jgi:hypothetical protein
MYITVKRDHVGKHDFNVWLSLRHDSPDDPVEKQTESLIVGSGPTEHDAIVNALVEFSRAIMTRNL